MARASDEQFQKWLEKTESCSKCGVVRNGKGFIGLYKKDGRKVPYAWNCREETMNKLVAYCKPCASEVSAEAEEKEKTEAVERASTVLGPLQGQNPKDWLFFTLGNIREVYAKAIGKTERLTAQELCDTYLAYIKEINSFAG